MVDTLCKDWDAYERLEKKGKRKLDDSDASQIVKEEPRKRRDTTDVIMLDVPTPVIKAMSSTDIDNLKAWCNDVLLDKLHNINSNPNGIEPDQFVPPWLTKLNKARYTTVGSLGGWQSFNTDNLTVRLVEILGGNVNHRKGTGYWEKALTHMQKWSNTDMLVALQKAGSKITLEDLDCLRPQEAIKAEVIVEDSHGNEQDLVEQPDGDQPNSSKQPNNNDPVIIDDDSTDNQKTLVTSLSEFTKESVGGASSSMPTIATLRTPPEPPSNLVQTTNNETKDNTTAITNPSERSAHNVPSSPVISPITNSEPLHLSHAAFLSENLETRTKPSSHLPEKIKLLKDNHRLLYEQLSLRKEHIKLLQENNSLLHKQNMLLHTEQLKIRKTNEKHEQTIQENTIAMNKYREEMNILRAENEDVKKVVMELYGLFKTAQSET